MWDPDSPDDESLPMPEEFPTRLYLNGHLAVRVQSTRLALTDWAFGYLFGQGVIRRPEDVAGLTVDPMTAIINAYVPEPPAAQAPPVLEDESGPLPLTVGSTLQTSHRELAWFQGRMQAAAVLYAATGGMHVAALCRVTDGAMIAREDIGRHNAVDKVIGAALLEGWDPGSLVLLTSGRIAAEMCRKAALFGIGVVASRSAVTDQAVRLAARYGMAAVGYLRPHAMRVYTGHHRLADDPVASGAGDRLPVPENAPAPITRLQTMYGE